MNTAISTTTEPINTGLSVFDEGTFTAIMRIADAMAQSSLIPETLRSRKVGNQVEEYPLEKVRANCFLVIEQAQRWGLSPFACIACASVVHGRLMWEGKLVAGVLEANLGVRLSYEYKGAGETMEVVVSGTIPGETQSRSISGNVRDWKTDQWAAKNYEQRLAYRGAREWTRRHAPGVLLGVITEDEYVPEMRDVTPQGRVIPADQQVDPFQGTALETIATEEPAAQPAPAAEAPLPANPQTIPATGRQKKDRIVRDAKYQSIAEKETTKGQPFFVVATHISGKLVEFTTFSLSMAESLRGLDKGTPIRITVTLADKEKNTFALEEYEIIKGEGELI